MRRFALAIAVVLLMPSAAMATSLECDVSEECPQKPRHAWVPYGFYNKSTGLAGAVAFVGAGYLQPQFTAVVNVFAGTNDTLAGYALTQNYRLGESRWFVDTKLLAGTWGEIESYQNGKPGFSGERAGSNDSSKDNFLKADGTDQYYRLTFKYPLPIGAAANNPIHTYRTRGGLLEPGSESGGKEWNPLRSGITTLELEPFFREQDLTDDTVGELKRRTAGLTARLVYDNTDWHKNPSYGSRSEISFSQDPGALSDAPKWSQVQLEYSKYFPLGQWLGSRQRVLAFDVWTSYVPTWDKTEVVEGQEVFKRPPVFLGSTLGGIDRQRGYPTNRFNDKAAINYQLEYRHTAPTNPLDRFKLLEGLQMRWIQYVAFVEVGRVADTWNTRELHSDMKSSLGVGARLHALGLVVRVDWALSEEGSQVQMFVGQTF